MGNAFSCIERPGEHWDKVHSDIQEDYQNKSSITHDMTLPLSCYFISSGHNSYLTGNQLSSKCGTSTIEFCLKRACRVIELDVYDEQLGFKGPICKHGGTLTYPVTFQECVQSIGEHAFTASPYPVIITIENHTNEESQKQMADILQTVLGSKLYIPEEGEAGKQWKSPEQLKFKVLIRTNASKASPELKRLIYIANTKFKSLEEANKSGQTTSSSFDEGKAYKLVKRAFHESALTWRQTDPGKHPTRKYQSSNAFSFNELDAKAGKVERAKSKVAHMVEAPVDEVGDEVVASVHSLTEVYTYTANNLMRVYPGGLRVDSSNYDPMHAWIAGASFAALNWQNWDQALWINHAMFSQNGHCGYVLKPDWMVRTLMGRPSSGPNGLEESPSLSGSPVPNREPRQLAVHVYSAYVEQGGNFACFKDDVYLEMSIIGMPMDKRKENTDTADNTGRLRVGKTYTFNVLYPEIAVLLLVLKDEDFQPGRDMDDLLGHWEAPLSELKSGRYKLRLQDDQQQITEKRWVRVSFEWLTGENGAVAAGLGDAVAAVTATGNPLSMHRPSPLRV